MMDVLKEAPVVFDVERLGKIFMDHSASCNLCDPPTSNDIKRFIDPVIRLLPNCTIKPTTIDAASRKCFLCNAILEPKPVLTLREYQKLKESFLESVLRMSESLNGHKRTQAINTFKYLETLLEKSVEAI
uniref:Uncharacterized protein n=1 Tax=Ditylenchus dipsaci TaxID=166011 RepID=A0A915DRE4_9BILA